MLQLFLRLLALIALLSLIFEAPIITASQIGTGTVVSSG